MNNFLITSVDSRCGTKFLATYMNLSKKWSVLHDIHNKKYSDAVSFANNRFTKDYYGEVNTFLRGYFLYVDVKKYGFILRNPLDIFLSAKNWNPTNPDTEIIASIKKGFKLIPKISENTKLILFKRMITDKKYLKTIFNFFDIDDVNVNNIDLSKKINMPKKYIYSLRDYKNLSLQYEFAKYMDYKTLLMKD